MIVRVSHGPTRAVLFCLFATFGVDKSAMTIWPFFPYIVTILILKKHRGLEHALDGA